MSEERAVILYAGGRFGTSHQVQHHHKRACTYTMAVVLMLDLVLILQYVHQHQVQHQNNYQILYCSTYKGFNVSTFHRLVAYNIMQGADITTFVPTPTQGPDLIHTLQHQRSFKKWWNVLGQGVKSHLSGRTKSTHWIVRQSHHLTTTTLLENRQIQVKGPHLSCTCTMMWKGKKTGHQSLESSSDAKLFGCTVPITTLQCRGGLFTAFSILTLCLKKSHSQAVPAGYVGQWSHYILVLWPRWSSPWKQLHRKSPCLNYCIL